MKQIQSVEELLESFKDKFPELREYYPAYWSTPDKDGTQTAIPSNIKDMTAVVSEWLNSASISLLKHAQEEIEKSKRPHKENPNHNRDEIYCCIECHDDEEKFRTTDKHIAIIQSLIDKKV